MNFKEIEIPVPWGLIAGKCCGDPKDDIVLALHGYQDNANSFDQLIPLLPKSFYYVCIDLPSHGKSSHLVTKALLNTFDFVLSLKFVVDYFHRDKFILMGHSFGAQINIFFAQMYPDCVSKLIAFDAIYYLPSHPKVFIANLQEAFKRYDKLHKLSVDTAPTYTFEEAIAKARDSRVVPMTEEAACILIQRSLEPVENGRYKIRTAQHLKYHLRPPFSMKYQKQLLKYYPIKCPHLIIGASESQIYRALVRETIDELENNPLHELYVVEGNHDIHMEKAPEVAKFVTEFLLKIKHKL